jgi:hypothetical protein
MASGQVAANGNDCPGDVVTNTLAVGTQHDGCDRNPIFGRYVDKDMDADHGPV